jgi:hypothetical protein
MTEAEWLTNSNPYILGKLPAITENKRRVRLYAVACCRGLAQWFHDSRLKKAVDAAEKYADGNLKLATLEGWNSVANEAHRTCPKPHSVPMQFPPEWQANYAVINATHNDDHINGDRLSKIVLATIGMANDSAMIETQNWLCHLIRDIFGNPFRSISFDLSWRTSTAVAIAKQMYESRDFSAMPILADALQDAGCENGDILDHCRAADGIHVRGCWVVDLVLDKS